MNEKTEMLHKICKSLMEELEEYSKKIDKADGMNVGDLDAVDKLSHALKSIKTTIAMMEAGEEGGYSGRYIPYYGGMAYAQGDNRGGTMGGTRSSYNDGMSYAGRRNARRDSMGRYSSEGGYSRAEDGMQELIAEMRDVMGDLPDHKRMEVQRFIEKMERM